MRCCERRLPAVRGLRMLPALYQSILMLIASAATNTLRAQVDVERLPSLQCAKTVKAGHIKRRESVPARDSVEACRAISLSVAAALRKYPGTVDSTVIWRHDFPDLGTRNVNSLYQISLYITHAKRLPSAFSPKHVEVVVDRKTFVARVSPLEQ
jgi:hypothetical protein